MCLIEKKYVEYSIIRGNNVSKNLVDFTETVDFFTHTFYKPFKDISS